jgi:hypothetical protein
MTEQGVTDLKSMAKQVMSLERLINQTVLKKVSAIETSLVDLMVLKPLVKEIEKQLTKTPKLHHLDKIVLDLNEFRAEVRTQFESKLDIAAYE